MSPSYSLASKETRVKAIQSSLAPKPSFSVCSLTSGQESEVLAFLATRPLHSVFLSGFVRDNGLLSPLNRGTFYACRDSEGRLEGVALIGHAVLFEALSETVIQAFACLAQEYRWTHMILGEKERVGLFWKYYAPGGQPPRRLGHELLFEKQLPREEHPVAHPLRLATSEDLPSVMLVQAQMASAESGVNPMEIDPTGFRLRCLRRIEKGRVWVWTENDRLIFKCDVMAHTPDVIYLEGVYVTPEERGNGYGLKCLSQLGKNLSSRTKSLCLLVNDEQHEAHDFYRRAGFELRSRYETVFLRQQEDGNAKMR